jgi:2-polyprenyl-3-methyl-5-hydroxy-6-metoxy-1,4-benzoquinol methylase
LPQNLQARILEIGPGLCEVAGFLVNEKGYSEVDVVDRDEEVIQLAKRMLPGRCDITDDMELFLSERPSEFDCIIMMHVLEHLTAAKGVSILGKIAEALKPGGSLLLEVPNAGHPLAGGMLRYGDPTHETGYTVTSLYSLASQAGFDSIVVRGASVPIVSIGRWLQWCAQKVSHFILSALLKPYLPNERIVTATAISLIARR